MSMACFLLQILQAKRKLRLTSAGPKEGSSAAPPGEAITHFEPPSRTIAVLKKEIREATNRIGEELDEDTREAVVAEGLKVFELNNVVIRSVRGVDDMIELLVARLDEMGILDDTYIFFTSDHGYKLGEWRLGCSKQGRDPNSVWRFCLSVIAVKIKRSTCLGLMLGL